MHVNDILRQTPSTITAMTPKKDTPLAFRIPADLKVELQRMADREARSISQICEILLRIGTAEYRKGGPRFLERYLGRRVES